MELLRDIVETLDSIHWLVHDSLNIVWVPSYDDSLKNQLQKRELAIIYQNKHNFGHTEAGLRESWAMSMISGMLHVQQN